VKKVVADDDSDNGRLLAKKAQVAKPAALDSDSDDDRPLGRLTREKLPRGVGETGGGGGRGGGGSRGGGGKGGGGGEEAAAAAAEGEEEGLGIEGQDMADSSEGLPASQKKRKRADAQGLSSAEPPKLPGLTPPTMHRYYTLLPGSPGYAKTGCKFREKEDSTAVKQPIANEKAVGDGVPCGYHVSFSHKFRQKARERRAACASACVIESRLGRKIIPESVRMYLVYGRTAGPIPGGTGWTFVRECVSAGARVCGIYRATTRAPWKCRFTNRRCACACACACVRACACACADVRVRWAGRDGGGDGIASLSTKNPVTGVVDLNASALVDPLSGTDEAPPWRSPAKGNVFDSIPS
jgi:hypothetical protein